MAHEGVGHVGCRAVSAIRSAIAQADIDVGVTITVEVGDRHKAVGIDGGVATARGEGTVAFPQVGQDVASCAEDQVEFAVIVEITAGEVWPRVAGADGVGEGRSWSRGEGTVAIAEEHRAVGANNVFLADMPEVGGDQVDDGRGGGVGIAGQGGRGKILAAAKVPSPFPSRTEISWVLETETMSSFPSPLTSSITAAVAEAPAVG